MKVSIITPWLNAPELMSMYERGCAGAQIVIVDNGSDLVTANQLADMCERAGGVYIRNDTNMGFSHANNQGLEKATGDIIVFMNNDVECRPGWLDKAIADCEPGVICGPSKMNKYGVDYIEGWCIAARRELWEKLGGWNTWDYSGLYWEDNDLCLRALRAGMTLRETRWPVWHFNNYTTRRTPGATDRSAANEAIFAEKVREWRQA